MTIASAITAAQGRVANAYTAVSEMSGVLPATQNLANLPAAIKSIVTGTETYDADLVLKGVVDGLPQPDEETVVDATIAILEAI